MPRPSSTTAKRTNASSLVMRDVDRAAVRRVLDGVVEQVREDLAQLVRVGGDRRHVRARPRGRASRFPGRCARRGSTTADASSRRVAALDLDVQRARLEPAHPEDVVDDPREPLGLGGDDVEQPLTLRARARHRRALKGQRGAVDRRERRAELVRDRRDELALQALDAPLLGQVAERVDGAAREARRPRSRASARRARARAARSRRAASRGRPRRGRAPRSPPSPAPPRRPAGRRRPAPRRPVITSAAAFQMRTIPSSSTSTTPSATNASARAACARCSERP